MITVLIDGVDLAEYRARIARWYPEVAEVGELAVRRAIEDTLADAAIRNLAALRMGARMEESSFRSSLKRQQVLIDWPKRADLAEIETFGTSRSAQRDAMLETIG
jgi:predicted ABC-class ATPase